MGHYFLNDNNIESNVKKLKYTFKGKVLDLETDRGIFCKDHIDFGTNILLNNLPEFKGSLKVVDVGCGYGLIGLCIAKAYPEFEVNMIDVNQRALDIAIKNARFNKIGNAKIFESDVYKNVDEHFDVIITNPPIRAGKSVVHEIVINGYEKLNTNGRIFVVIQKKQGAPSLIAKMEEVYDEVNIINKEKGYFIIEGCRR